MKIITSKKGFTLLELLISMIIIGILAALVSGNFFTSLKKGRDARRKADIQQVQRALEIYYEDKRAYPSFALTFGTAGLCETKSVADCGSEKTYMGLLPQDPQKTQNSCQYMYVHETTPNGEGYALYAPIENVNDTGTGIKQSGYSTDSYSGTSTTCGGCGCKFKIGSSNYP